MFAVVNIIDRIEPPCLFCMLRLLKLVLCWHPDLCGQKPHGDSLTRFSFCHEKQFMESIPLSGKPTGNLCAMGSASRDFLG